MKVDTLEKLYEDQMSSMRNGEEQLLELLTKLLGVASHHDLRNSFREIIPHVREHISRIESFMPDDGVTQQANDSPAMRGLIGEMHAFLERASDPDVIDAGLVSRFQQILHYSMAGYGSLRTFAILLGREEEARAFQRSIDEQVEAEDNFSQIALDAVNNDALSASTRVT